MLGTSREEEAGVEDKITTRGVELRHPVLSPYPLLPGVQGTVPVGNTAGAFLPGLAAGLDLAERGAGFGAPCRPGRAMSCAEA